MKVEMQEPQEQKTRIYVAGPMSSKKDDDWNFVAFHRATLLLRALGHIVVNPAEIDEALWGFDGRRDKVLVPKMSYRVVLSIDIGTILPTCDAIYMLTGWSESIGACIEIATAKAYGMEIMYEAGAERGRVGFIPEESTD